jgi:hypothetical protein
MPLDVRGHCTSHRYGRRASADLWASQHARVGIGEGYSEGGTWYARAGDAYKGQAAMTSDDFREQCIAMINQILDQGFEHPIYFAAVAIDGLTVVGSSETVTAPAQLMLATSGPFAMYLLPINFLFVDPKGKAAHGVIDGSGAVSCCVLH